MAVDLMIKIAIIGHCDRGKSTLYEYLKSLYKEEEITYLDSIDQLVNEVKEDNNHMIDLSKLKIIMLDSTENLSKKSNFSLNHSITEYIKEDASLLRYLESSKEKYDKDKLKKDNYKSKQKIRNYKR